MNKSHSYNSELNFTFDEEIINLAIIGAGRAGAFHVQSLSINKQYNLQYIIDLDIGKAKNLSDEANCKYSDDLDSVLLTDISCVIICTTTPTHYNLTMKCLESGKHVICEKPIGKTIDEINNCFSMAKIKNVKLLIAYQKRFDNNYNKLYELLQLKKQNGFIINNINCTTRDHPLPTVEYLSSSNGIVEDMISHDIDITNVYMDFEEPIKVIAFTDTKNNILKENNEIENIQIMMQYKNGIIVNLSGSRDSKHGYDQRVEVFGNFGMYKLENQIDNNISYYDDKGSNYSKMNYSFKQRYKDAYIKELDYMYKMIVNDYEPLIKENHLILTKKICNAINLSIKENKLIYLKN